MDHIDNIDIIPEADSLKNAEPKEIADLAVRLLDSKRGREIKQLYVEKQTILTEYFVICTGNSTTQVKAMADEVEYKMQLGGLEPLHVEGVQGGSWILIDYGAVIIHIFNKEARDFYKLDKLWSDASETDISGLVDTRE